MIPETYSQIITLSDGRTIELETGKLAKQADGSVVVRMGDTIILATVVSSKEAKEGIDFLPLTVDYREKYSAGGRFPGGFFKREARPSTEEILTMRLVDRVLRPLFPKDYYCETQIMIQLLSYDPKAQPEALTGLAASTALALSDIPFEGPISEVRIVRKNGVFVINPGLEDTLDIDMDLMIGASEDSIVMLEGEMDEISEGEIIEAIQIAHEAIKDQILAQKNLVEKVGKKEIRLYEPDIEDEELRKKIFDDFYQTYYQIAKESLPKHERSERFDEVEESFSSQYSEEELEEIAPFIKRYFEQLKKETVRNLILEENLRLDGRSSEEIRPIWCEVDILPSSHGSAVFTRGETQSLATVTLGNSRDANIIDGVAMEGEERFYLHYNFPPFSTGEARPIRGTSRREIGHGNLAQRALKSMVSDEDNPYVIRVVSDILESNGSSSMATVCAGTIALLDAGIQMKRPVSGIAMGLIMNQETGQWKVLSDILGDEDFLGDMDFKVTGTRNGITACQMDIKIKGLTFEILNQALAQAKEGRLYILEKLEETIPKARDEYKDSVPKMAKMVIQADFIGAVIGPGGKTIQTIQADTDTTIVLGEKDGEGHIEISGFDREKINEAIKRIETIAFTPKVGVEYDAIVRSIMPYGAFVEIAKGVEGLVHISEIEWRRLKTVDEVLSEGDSIRVKLIGIDEKRGGKLKLSRKVLLPKPAEI